MYITGNHFNVYKLVGFGMFTMLRLPSTETFLSPRRATLCPLSCHSPAIPLAPGIHYSVSCLHEFTYSGYFIKMESYDIQFCV